MDALQVPQSWEALGPELLRGPASVLVIGGTDAGKTTFCRWLAAQLSARAEDVWLIDADVGQSWLGPPATVGCGRVRPDGLREEMAFFVGDVSSGRSVAQCLGALAAAVLASRRAGAERLVVDTTGWISGSEAIAMKLAKAWLMGPSHIVLIEAQHELRAYRRAWHRQTGFPLHHLRPAPSVVRRSQAHRRAFREAAFRSAFEGAVECEIDLREVAISGPRDLEAALPHMGPGRLLGLGDSTGALIGLGVLLSLDSRTARLNCLCRPQAVGATEVRVGQLALRPDGTHSPISI